MSSAANTSAPTTPRISTRAELDEAISVLQERKWVWAHLPVEHRIEYAKSIHSGSHRVAAAQVEVTARAKGVPSGSAVVGEDWLAGPYIQIRALRLLIESLEQIRTEGAVRIAPRRVRVRPDGQVAVEVFPCGLYDRLLYAGFRGEVWMQPEVTAQNLARHTGALYRSTEPRGEVSLILGAGNVASIGPLDTVHKLFTEGRVVLLKLNPVNEYLGPFIEEAFSELIRDGFVRTAYGGAEVGQYLCRHGGIDEIHITGSDRTHDTIVFGTGEEGQRRKAANEPLLRKRITSELGNVGPMILVPGRWSPSDLRHQAANVATQIAQNGGFNCNATRVLVTHRDWAQREEFLDSLREVLRGLPRRPAYYPGAEERLAEMLEVFPGAECLGPREPGFVPPTLVAGVDPGDETNPAFRRECFCSVAVETSLGGADPADFLENAVRFANDRLWGSLNAGIIVDPRARRALGGSLEEAVAGLRYGAVALNHWPALIYAFGCFPWGAFPGHTLDDVQSGIGTVHNSLLFDLPQKSVIDGPFRVRPKPTWFVTHRDAAAVARRITALEAVPGARHLPGIVRHALRG